MVISGYKVAGFTGLNNFERRISGGATVGTANNWEEQKSIQITYKWEHTELNEQLTKMRTTGLPPWNGQWLNICH